MSCFNPPVFFSETKEPRCPGRLKPGGKRWTNRHLGFFDMSKYIWKVLIHSWKPNHQANMSSSLGIIIPNIWRVIIHSCSKPTNYGVYIYIFQLYIRQLHNLYIENSCVGIVIQLMMINWCESVTWDLCRQNIGIFRGVFMGLNGWT